MFDFPTFGLPISRLMRLVSLMAQFRIDLKFTISMRSIKLSIYYHLKILWYNDVMIGITSFTKAKNSFYYRFYFQLVLKLVIRYCYSLKYEPLPFYAVAGVFLPPSVRLNGYDLA